MHRDRKQIRGGWGRRGSLWGVKTDKDTASFWGVIKKCSKIDLPIAAHICEYTKNYRLALLKEAYYTYLNYISKKLFLKKR